MKGKFNDIWVRIIGIPLVGAGMPLVFCTGNCKELLLEWIIISFIITLFAWETCRALLLYISKKINWDNNPSLHIISVSGVLILLSGVIIFLLSFANHKFALGNNMKGPYITSVLLCLFITASHEIYFLFERWKKSIVLTANLEKENALARYETLKNQLSPHFLFNNLSILSSLSYPDPEPEKLKNFIDEFASVYRYILETTEEQLVQVNKELEFVQSYIYLLKIRHDNKIIVDINLDSKILCNYLPPLSLQILIENAVKHNSLSETNPLNISISNTNDTIIVVNNIQLRNCEYKSHKMGHKNLINRYLLISRESPGFYTKNDKYISEIPTFKPE
ncbi:MAG: histidine kinase [Bacteroidales bacterium]|nr:histidine kinase [Bacteroidales bacterium]